MQAIGEQAKAIQGVADSIPKQITAAVQPLAQDLSDLKNYNALERKIKAKLEADAEEGGLKGKLAQRLLDKEADSPGALRHEMFIVACVLGGLIICVWGGLLVYRTGRGIAGTVVAKQAAEHPDNPRLQELSAKLDAIGSRAQEAMLHAKLAINTAGLAANVAKQNPVGAVTSGVSVASDVAKIVAANSEQPSPVS